MSLLSSRRRPWPFHTRIGSILGTPESRMGFMLIPNDQGLMIGRKQQMLDGVVPSEQEYGSAPVYRERTALLRPTAGYGERVQSSYGDRRYYWGKNIQVAGNLFGKGPLVHTITPTSAAGGQVWQFIDVPANGGGSSIQLIFAGTKCYRRTDDTNAGQAVDKDFGAGQLPASAAVFQGGFSGAVPSTYVACSGSLWERKWDGTWTVCALPSGFGVHRVEVVGTELWAADCINSVIRKVTSDPKVAGNWSGPFFVGTPAAKISSIRQCSNQLVIFKEDGGVFTLNSDGTTNDLFPALRDAIDSDNGWRSATWLNNIWFKVGPSSYFLQMPGANLQPIGPGRLLDNASPVRGISQAFAAWGGYRAYMGLYNPGTNTSYLLSYGNWEPADTPDSGQAVKFDDQWDGSLAEWPSRVITAMGVSGVTGASSDRLYVGLENGTWSWIKLVRSPFALGLDSTPGDGGEFTTDPSEIVFPLHHAMFNADLKHWMGFSLFGPVMQTGDEVILSYRLMASAGAPPVDPTSQWIELGEFVQNGQRIPAPPNLAGNAISLKATLNNTTTADTPVLETVAVHERVVPSFKRDLSFTLDARGYQARMDGSVVRYENDKAHQIFMDFAALPGSMAVELPDETVNEVAWFGYTERLLPMQAGGGHGWAVDCQLTQFRILTTYGIIDRLGGTTIDDLHGYTIDSLETL